MTLHEQKTALAEWALDLLIIRPEDKFAPLIIYWKDTGAEVRDREWLEVAWRLERRLPTTISTQYYILLSQITMEANPQGDRIMFKLISATALQRLEALCRVLWPERFK